MTLHFRRTEQRDINGLFTLRAATRENPISRERLAALGITPESSSAALTSGEIVSWVCEASGELAGFCSGDPASAEVLVLAVLPQFEGLGVGKGLLSRVIEQLASQHASVWLAANPDPTGRAHGFYRAFGFTATGKIDDAGDEILRYAALI
jgi:ribosomal protein S18 acetylase RimI-like enzyme